ncbi:cell division control protein Cdc6 [Candidatus Bathyarchaeota archaeon]|nr:MAG: cell division control protein Cdc6 [Candidatus Bathyarchaeota archaeon]
MKHSDILDELFDNFLNHARIFRNRDVLRHDYIPSYLPHRESEMRRVGEVIAPALKECRCSNLFIYGKPGTGKTAVTKYVLGRVQEKAKELGAPIAISYINCRLVGTEYRVFFYLCNSVGIKVPFTGLALGEIFDRFKDGIDLKKTLLIVVLDEIDALVKSKGDTLLYELTRINENLTRSKVSIIGISNDLRFKEWLDPRVLSSLSEEELVFRPYNAAELRDILAERAKLAFYEGVLSDGALSLCAALAAAEHGDARRALDLLRVAGELAEREGAKQIVEEHVRLAEKRIEHNRIFEAIKNLPLHSKLVFCSVYLLAKANVNDAITGDIYAVYCEICSEVGVAPLTQRRVSTLISELDAIGLLNSRVVSLGRYGRTKKIRLGIGRSIIREVFQNDERLGSLINYAPKCLHKAKDSGN